MADTSTTTTSGFDEEAFLERLRALSTTPTPTPAAAAAPEVPSEPQELTPLVQPPVQQAVAPVVPVAPTPFVSPTTVPAVPAVEETPAPVPEDDFESRFSRDFSLIEQSQAFPTDIKDFAQINRNYSNIVGKGSVDLPSPNTEMYDDLRVSSGLLGLPTIANDQQREEFERMAQERYQAYAQHPDATVSSQGEVVYKNRIVPPYSQDLITGAMDVGLTPVDISGISSTAYPMYMGLTRTGPKAIAEVAAAGIDAASSYLFNYNPQLTEKAQDLADLGTGESIVDSILNEGSGMFVGLGGSAALINRLPKTVPAVVNLINKTGKMKGALTAGAETLAAGAKAIGLEAGMTAATKSEADTLLIGKDAMLTGGRIPLIGIRIPIIEGIEAAPDSPEFEQVLSKRVNILADSLSIAKGVEGAGKLGYFTLKLVGNSILQPIKFMVSAASTEAKQQDIIIKNIIEKLAGVAKADFASTPEQYNAFVNEIADLIEQGANINIKIPYDQVADVNADIDTMSALIRALEMGDQNKATEILAARASALQRGQLQSGGQRTISASSTMAKEAKRAFEQTEELLGYNLIKTSPSGRQMTDIDDFYSIVEMRDFFQKQGMDEVAARKKAVDVIGQEYRTLETAIDQKMRTDDSMFGRLEKLSQDSGIDLRSPARKSANELVDRLITASKVMDDKKNDLFRKVKGGKVDTDGLVDSLLDTIPESDLDKYLFTVSDPYYSGLMKQLVGATKDEVKTNFAKWAADNKLDFATLFTKVRPSLAYSISRLDNLARQGDFAAGNTRDRLRALTKYIDNDAIKYVEKTGDANVRKAAQDAMDYYRKWATYWKEDTPLFEFGNLRRKTIDRGKGNDEFSVKARGIIEEVLTEKNQEYGVKLINLLKSPTGGGNALVVTDYIIGNVFEDLAPKIREQNGLSNVDLNEVSAKLSPYAVFIEKKFPAEYKKIMDLVDFLEASKAKKSDLSQRADEAKVQYKKAEQEVLQKTLRDFFETSLDTPVSSGYEAMKSVFNNNSRGVDLLQQLHQRSRADNMAKYGMQSAFLRWAKDKAFIKTTSTGDAGILSTANMSNMESGLSNMMNYARILFDDVPEFPNALQTILEETKVIQRSKTAKALPLESPSAALLEQQRKFNAGVTQIMGVLNRWSARFRNIASVALTKRFNEEKYLAIQDSLLSDPAAFIEAAKKVVDTSGKVSKENTFKFFVHVGIYREDEESRKEFDSVYAEKEEDEEPSFLEGAARSARDVGAQMMEMFGL
jgi:hypothetical protein